MRRLSATLNSAQKQLGYIPLLRVVLAKTDETTYTYTLSDTAIKLYALTHPEAPYNQQAIISLDNSDASLTDIDFKGYTATISYGMHTTSDEYSACAPLTVTAQQFLSIMGKLTCALTAVGIPNLMGFDKANDNYTPADDDTTTAKTLIRKICGDTGVSILDCFDHCTSYDIEFDSEDSLIDSFQPKDSFRIGKNSSRLEAFKRLMKLIGCVAIVKADGKWHIFVPIPYSADWVADTAYSEDDRVKPTTENGFEYICTTAGTSDSAENEPTWPTTEDSTVAESGVDTLVWTTVWYDYEYELVSGEHHFFAKAYRKRIVIPSYVEVSSRSTDEDDYTGYAEDTDVDEVLRKREYIELKAADDAQCTAIATARLLHHQLDAERGAGSVPMNVGAECYDYVNLTDVNEEDNRVGSIGVLTRYFRQGKFSMEFHFGGIELGAGLIIPGLSGAGGGAGAGYVDYWDEIYQLMLDMLFVFDSLKLIDARLDALEAGLGWDLSKYIWIDGDGNLIIRPEWGQWIGLIGKIWLKQNENFGFADAAITEACRLFWYTFGGTYDHVICPDVTGHGKLGDTTYKWLEANIRKVYTVDRFVFPVGTDMYD